MHMSAKLRQLLQDSCGISIVEFALFSPLLIGAIFAALEMSEFIIANQRMQRIAANMGDMVAQSGTASIGASERQINDILSAMQYAAKPFRLREEGRVIITAVQGQKDGNKDAAGNDVIRNRKLWHRCDGLLTGQPNKIPGAVNTWITLPSGRTLLEGEILIHSQLVYKFEPLTGVSIGDYLWNRNNQYVLRTASFRPRSKTFVGITPDGTTPKSNCPTT